MLLSCVRESCYTSGSVIRKVSVLSRSASHFIEGIYQNDTEAGKKMRNPCANVYACERGSDWENEFPSHSEAHLARNGLAK